MSQRYLCSIKFELLLTEQNSFLGISRKDYFKKKILWSNISNKTQILNLLK